LDALADALPDAAEGAHPEPPYCLGVGAEKLADPVLDVQGPDAQSLPPERLAQLNWSAPYTPDEVPCGGQSCAVTALADALAQLAARALWLLEALPAAVQPAGLQQLKPHLVAPEAAQLAGARAAPVQALLAARQQSLEAAQLAALEPKMSASG